MCTTYYTVHSFASYLRNRADLRLMSTTIVRDLQELHRKTVDLHVLSQVMTWILVGLPRLIDLSLLPSCAGFPGAHFFGH